MQSRRKKTSNISLADLRKTFVVSCSYFPGIWTGCTSKTLLLMLRRSKNGKQGLEIYAENFFISFVLSPSSLRPCTSGRPACPFPFALNSIQCSFLGGRVGGGLASAGRIKGSSVPHTFLCQSVLTRTARDWGGKYSRMVVKLILSIFALLFEFFLPREEKGRGKMGNEAVKFSDVGEKGAKSTLSSVVFFNLPCSSPSPVGALLAPSAALSSSSSLWSRVL